jgi:predicted negative regulator of RcsB-dependent stress response
MNKKTIIIIVSVLIVGVAAYFGFKYYQNKKAQNESN